jgi:diacylglycerol kinase family enzyme
VDAPLPHPPLVREDLEEGQVRRQVALIVNPYATSVSRRVRNLVVAALRSRYDVLVIDTKEPGHATHLAREAAEEGADAVITLGGDGTVNEAANGLAGSDVPLFPLPGGSQNVYTKMLGIPGDIVDATQHLLRIADNWRPRRVDLGRVEGRLFTFSAGAGLDASVVERVDANPEKKARWRERYYAVSAARVFLRRYIVRPPRIRVESPGSSVRGVTVIVQNGDPYTYFGERPIRVCEGIGLDDGTLSAAVLERASPVDLPTMGARLLADGLEVTDHSHASSLPGLDSFDVHSVGDTQFAVQVDGDFLGRFDHVRFEAVPDALTVVS